MSVSLGTLAPPTTARICCWLAAAVLAGVALPLTPPTLAASSITHGPVRGKLVCQNHSPRVGRKWTYSVSVTDSHGHKLSGTLTTEYTFGGSVVGYEQPKNKKFKNGYYHDRLTFPASAVGHPLNVRVLVRTKDGSITLNWAITVKK